VTLKTPSFWYRDTGTSAPFMEKALVPVSSLYNFFFALHQKTHKAEKVFTPIICIGNIVAGGTGKTPTSIALMNTLLSHNIAKKPFFLIRGYGGAETGPTLVDLKTHTAWDVGDEALILAKHGPTIVGGDRVQSAHLAAQHGADMLLMDDGLQHARIYKDLKLVVINGEMGFGNKKLIPAGPLRQKLSEGLALADGFILIGEDLRNIVADLPASKPLIKASLKPTGDFKADKTQTYIAFAGLGYPDKFFNFLKDTLKLNVPECISFSDHHPYDEDDLMALNEKAQALSARLITTEKDYLRLPKVDGITVETVPVEMMWDSEDDLIELIKERLS